MCCLRVDVDENPTITEDLLVKSVPTTLVFFDGDEIARFEGPYSREALEDRIGKLMDRAVDHGVGEGLGFPVGFGRREFHVFFMISSLPHPTQRE